MHVTFPIVFFKDILIDVRHAISDNHDRSVARCARMLLNRLQENTFLYSNLPCGKSKGKVGPTHAMKSHVEVKVLLHSFLTSTLDGGKCSASCPGCISSRKRALSTHWIESWVYSRASLDFCRRNKSFAPAGIWTLDRPGQSLVTILTMLSWLFLPCASNKTDSSLWPETYLQFFSPLVNLRMICQMYRLHQQYWMWNNKVIMNDTLRVTWK
jgi:hypothetical protein